jgi:deoxyribose-phosphate aldolase
VIDVDLTTLAQSIDQTLLKPTVGLKAGTEWIAANRDHGFATLCVSPFLVPAAADLLAGTDTAVCSVAGFPLGYAVTAAKAQEATVLVELGCREVDMVINVGALLEGDERYVLADISAVVSAVERAGSGASVVKVILETAYLEEADIELGCRLAENAGAAFVKTSTGFGPRGASVRDVEIMRRTVSSHIGVKAAGGIRDLDAALAMLAAGATRLGTSAGVEILAEATVRGI